MDRVIIKKIDNIPGFPYFIRDEKLNKRNIILAPNAFGKTSIVNAIYSKFASEENANNIEISIQEDGNEYLDLNVIRFSANTLINSLAIADNKIDVGYEIVKKKRISKQIEELENSLTDSRQIVQTMFGYYNAQIVSKIVGSRGTNVVDICKNLMKEYDASIITFNKDIYNDLPNIYMDYQNNLNKIIEGFIGISLSQKTNLCELINRDLSVAIKRYFEDLVKHKCKLPENCPLCNKAIDSWDDIINHFKNLDFSGKIGSNDLYKRLDELIKTDFKSNLFQGLRNEIIFCVTNIKDYDINSHISNIQSKIAQQLVYQLNLAGFVKKLYQLEDVKKALNAINMSSISKEQILMIKQNLDRELQIFKKEHINIEVQDTYLKISMDNADIVSSLSESERNLISLLYFKYFIQYNTENSNKKTLILFDDPVDSYDENYHEEIASIISKIISDNYVLIFTHSLSAVETFSYVKVVEFSYYFYYIGISSPILIPIDKRELNALNAYGGDYGLVDYWLKQKDLKPKSELLILGAVPILRNSVEFIFKYLDKSENENDSSNPRKISTEMKSIYQSLCNNVSHYRSTGMRNINYVESEYKKIFKAVKSRRRPLIFNKLNRFTLVDYLIKDIINNFTLYKSNREFSNVILRRFIIMLFVKRTIEYNLINISRNLSLSINSLTSKLTLNAQIEYISDNIHPSDKDYVLFLDLSKYKNKYLNFINSMSHSSNRMIPPFLMINESRLRDIVDDLNSISDISFIC